jgi:hypothetical protein
VTQTTDHLAQDMLKGHRHRQAHSRAFASSALTTPVKPEADRRDVALSNRN